VPEVKAPKQRASRPAPKRPSELERIEAKIAAQEAEVAELEKQLAADWGNVETLAAHKRSREALAALLERWEALFEAQTERA
jgi:hypothetical protein